MASRLTEAGKKAEMRFQKARETCAYTLWKQILIEALATFLLIFVILVVAEVSAGEGFLGVLASALVQGLAVYHIASIFWRSGPHVNPWITFLALLAKSEPKIKLVMMLIYWFVQVVFAVLAAVVAKALLPTGNTAGLPTIDPAVSIGVAFVVEMLISFVFLLTFLVVSVNYRKQHLGQLMENNPTLVLGFTYTVLVFVGSVLGTGGAISTLRWFAPALALVFFGAPGFVGSWWIYPVSHIVGMFIAIVVFFFLVREFKPAKSSK